jgi:urease accessory protein
LTLLPPAAPTLTNLTYQYPLKLLTHIPRYVPNSSVLPCVSRSVHLYILSYGGGLLPGDEIAVSVTLNPQTRMVVTTPQGSNKIYRTDATRKLQPRLAVPTHGSMKMSRQTLDVHIGTQAAFCYLPDPNVPYKDSQYEQIQTYTMDATATGSNRGSLCVLDCVTEGRSALGENWDFHLWRGRNEVWSVDRTTGSKKLLLRDSVILDAELEDGKGPRIGGEEEPLRKTNLIRDRTGANTIVGTLILYGPVFETLAAFFMDRFATQPRLGAHNWSANSVDPTPSPRSSSDDVTWTAARVRAGFVLVKFGARDVDGARRWLGGLLREEGSIAMEFGEEALLCL